MEALAERLRLLLITDDRGRETAELARIVEAAIRGGVTAVPFREKSQPPEVNARAFALLREITARHGVLFLLNADLSETFPGWDRADGLHCSTRTLERFTGISPIVGYSAHSPADAAQGIAAGAAYCTISCVFDSPGKTEQVPAQGLQLIRETRRLVPGAPVIALGGITTESTARCMEAGADGVAIIRAVMSAPDPAMAAADMRREVDRAKSTE